MGYGSSANENAVQKTENESEEKKSGNEIDTKRKVEMNVENVSNTAAAASAAASETKTNDDVKVSLKRHFSDTLDSDSTVGGSSRDGDRDSDEREKRQKLDEELTKGLSSKRLKIADHESSSKDATEKEEENDDLKTDLKVPPLKIVLPSQNITDSDAANGNRSTRNGNSKNPSNLPYVISAVANDSMSENEDTPTSTTASGIISGSTVTVPATATPTTTTTTTTVAIDKADEKKDKEKEISSEDQRIANQRVLRSSHKLSQNNTSAISDGTSSVGNDSNYSSVTSTTLTSTSGSSFSMPSTLATVSTTVTTLTSTITPVSSSLATGQTTSTVALTSTTTGSLLGTSSTTTATSHHTDTVASETATATITTAVTSSETESDHSVYNEQESSSAVQLNSSVPITMSAVEMHPRKRKLKQTKEQSAPTQSSSSTQQYQDNSSSSEQFTNYSFHPHEQPISNCYQLFMDIRKQIEKKRKNLFPVQPKPPQSFNDYLMNRCNYILHGSPNAEMPHLDAPGFIPNEMRDFYIEQEKERHKLRMQHLSEKEKLVLSVEQEILRVHGRAARALANQSLPYSVCTILRDEEVYNFITPEQEEKDRNARSRYTGRLFLSWLQDVDDKWEKIKELMLIRHRMEAEALHGVQKMDWEWQIKDNFDLSMNLKTEESFIPKVVVNDNFDLLPT